MENSDRSELNLEKGHRADPYTDLMGCLLLDLQVLALILPSERGPPLAPCPGMVFKLPFFSKAETQSVLIIRACCICKFACSLKLLPPKSILGTPL